MVAPVSVPELRELADLLVQAEYTFNDTLPTQRFDVVLTDLKYRAKEVSRKLSIPVDVEYEVLSLIYGVKRLHLRLSTPTLEVSHAVSTQSNQAALRTASGRTAG